MSDEKQVPGGDELSLDTILKEISSWLEEPVSSAPAPSEEPSLSSTPNTSEEVEAPEQSSEPEPSDSDVSAGSEPADPKIVPLIPPTASAQEEEVPEEAEVPEPAPEEGPEEPPIPDNLIPFTPPSSSPEELSPPPKAPEPETMLKAAQLGASKAKAWVEDHRENIKKKPTFQMPKLSKPHLKLPALPKLPKPPDTPVKELASLYAKQLPGLRLKCLGAFGCTFILLLLAAIAAFPSLPLPAAIHNPMVLTSISLGFFALCLLLTYPILLQGLSALMLLRPSMHTLAALGAIFVLSDSLLLLFLHLRPMSVPLFAPSALVLTFQLWGRYNKTLALRLTCRTASSAAAPDLLTLEPSQWNGKGVYRRRFGSIAGFGSQVQEEDGAEQRFRRLTLVLLPAALLVSIVPALVSKQPQLILWALSATFPAAATLSGSLCFALPFRDLARRLSKVGVALAGWSGVCEARAGCGLLVESTDLFPPGSVKLTSYRAFEKHNPTYVISVTASLIRAAGGGLDSLFYSLMRTEGGSFVTATELDVESEGISAHVAGEPVYVGNLSFLARHGVDIPVGVRVPTGVFCAIGGSFAGQFVLEYSLHKHAASAMDSLLSSRVTPVLIGLDFNLVPSILKKLFHFPWDKMAFPDFTQRSKLHRAPAPRESTLLALLCLQGLAPVAAASAGAQRLQTAVRICTGFASFGAILGVMLTGYLASLAAFTALTPMGLSLFLISWFIPTALISGWVNQY